MLRKQTSKFPKIHAYFVFVNRVTNSTLENLSPKLVITALLLFPQRFFIGHYAGQPIEIAVYCLGPVHT